MCVGSLRYAARNAHAPYYIVIRVLSGSTIFFPHYLLNSTIIEIKVVEYIMCVLILSTTFT